MKKRKPGKVRKAPFIIDRARKVFYYVPVARQTSAKFIAGFDMARTIAANEGAARISTPFFEATSFDLATKRILGCQRFLDTDAEFMITVDDDMDFYENPHAIQMLLEAMDKTGADVMGAFYVMRSPPCLPCVQPTRGEGMFIRDIHKKVMVGEPEQVTGHVGTGCMVIRREALAKVATPWFQGKTTNVCRACKNEAAEETCPRCTGTGVDPEGFWHEYSEDAWFCKQVVDAGLKLFCHYGVQLGHIGDYTYTFEDTVRHTSPVAYARNILMLHEAEKAKQKEGLVLPDAVRPANEGATLVIAQ